LGLLAAATGAVLALDATGVIEGPLRAALEGDPAPAASPAVRPAAAPAVPVLAPIGSVVVDPPTATGVGRALAPLLRQPALGPRVGMSVVDLSTGAAVLNRGAAQTAIPASTTKVVTAAAALDVLGTQTRLATRVVDAGDQRTIVLVGGGDPTLRSTAASRTSDGPTLAELAARTAKALAAAGRDRVVLRIDDALFSPPRVSPAWEDTYVSGGVVAPVSALSVDGGRVDPASDVRSPDPARVAGQVFAEQLRAQGIAVRGVVSRTDAPTDAPLVAEVRSSTVEQLTARMLVRSDNDAAEALGHLVGAKATGEGSFESGARASLTVLDELGVPIAGVRLRDASGLSRDNLIPPATLTALIRTAASAEHPELRGVLTGLPIAGLSGTLDDRFAGPLTGSAAGDVRGKTGTLTGVRSLAGLVVDREGRQLVYAIIVDRVPDGGGPSAEAAIDRIVARLAACGCA
jgi:D-alanyl-D-alanine carboxypeptidase/D-alanyl-D-alanine-endopeptidase (penicillin-binding protein 4)